MSTDATAQLGTAEKSGDRYVLRFERRLSHPIGRVWAALTDPGEIVGWLAQADIDLREGGAVELRWLNTDDEGNQAVMHGTITRLEPPRLLEYDGDIHGLLRWELREDGDGTVLEFTNITPAPDEFLLKVLAGWHVHLEHLEDALEGRPVDWATWNDGAPRRRWQELHDLYAAQSL